MSMKLFWQQMRKDGLPTQSDELLMALMLVESAQSSLSDAGSCLPEYHDLRKQIELISQRLHNLQKQLGTSYRESLTTPETQWHDCTTPIDKDEETGEDLYDLPGTDGEYLVSIGDHVAVDFYDSDYGWDNFGTDVDAWAESPKAFKKETNHAEEPDQTRRRPCFGCSYEHNHHFCRTDLGNNQPIFRELNMQNDQERLELLKELRNFISEQVDCIKGVSVSAQLKDGREITKEMDPRAFIALIDRELGASNGQK